MPLRSMFRFLSACCAAAALCGALPPAANAQTDQDVDARIDTLFGAHETYRAFFDKLKQAVAAGDKNAVAAMIHYPIAVHRNSNGDNALLRNKREFVAAYAGIFTPELVDTVAHQQYAKLFVRDQGAMIGDGEIWFSGVCRDDACKDSDVRITAFNLE
ncbi:hypothetical protein [Caballeronia sp. GAFFF2]|uniref:hypothetical protein n=1 Tax=Caballeronia sp. GAFFF2 TaxID=2921741 RepID=UPI0020279BA9|nr:hypothetical protein [Caballeronia sp. GAFFF2]